MRRKTKALLQHGKESLILAIEIFNRPFDAARTEGVLLFLNHSFEMLLKAVVFEKTGKLRAKGDKYNYGFEKCVNLCETQLGVLQADESLILKNLNGFRDAAAHDIVDISEGLLYGHAQSAVLIFAKTIQKIFKENLVDYLPSRVLPLTNSLPKDIHAIVEEDMEMVSGLLTAKKRREDEAEAKLRPYQVVEKNVREMERIEEPVQSPSRLIKRIKAGQWKTALPMVAGLVQPDASGMPFSLRIVKEGGFPVRLDPNSSASIAFRYVKPEDKYPYLTGELARKLGISPSKLLAFVKAFGMKGNDSYHTSIKASKTGYVQRYSEKTYTVIEAALAKEGVDALWGHVKAGKQLNPADYG